MRMSTSARGGRTQHRLVNGFLRGCAFPAQTLRSLGGFCRAGAADRLRQDPVAHARRAIETWRIEYNTERLLSSLGDLTPEEYAKNGSARAGSVCCCAERVGQSIASAPTGCIAKQDLPSVGGNASTSACPSPELRRGSPCSRTRPHCSVYRGRGICQLTCAPTSAMRMPEHYVGVE
jgi:hypothetical protein